VSSTRAARKPRRAAPIPLLLVHGGAGALASDRDRRIHTRAVREALQHGLERLESGAAAAVLAAVSYMESETVLNAGRGATLDVSGRVTLDAGFMDGRTLRFGSVGCVTRTPNPIILAHALSRDGTYGRFLVGASADALVERVGAPLCSPEDLITHRALEVWRGRRNKERLVSADTVGAVALDAEGQVAAAVSTGGLSRKPAGRVGDSAVVGAGFWSENRLGACVTTGIGEAMLREGTARRCVKLLAGDLSPADAAQTALEELSDRHKRAPAGLILVTSDGAFAIAHTSPAMTAGLAGPGRRVTVRSRWA
jgi:L-asparaginase / beta-aspartyl-peptidase